MLLKNINESLGKSSFILKRGVYESVKILDLSLSKIAKNGLEVVVEDMELDLKASKDFVPRSKFGKSYLRVQYKC